MRWKFQSHHTAPMLHNLTFEFEAGDYEQAKGMIMLLFGVNHKWYGQWNIGCFADNAYEFVHQNMVMFFTLSPVEEKVTV